MGLLSFFKKFITKQKLEEQRPLPRAGGQDNLTAPDAIYVRDLSLSSVDSRDPSLSNVAPNQPSTSRFDDQHDQTSNNGIVDSICPRIVIEEYNSNSSLPCSTSTVNTILSHSSHNTDVNPLENTTLLNNANNLTSFATSHDCIPSPPPNTPATANELNIPEVTYSGVLTMNPNISF